MVGCQRTCTQVFAPRSWTTKVARPIVGLLLGRFDHVFGEVQEHALGFWVFGHHRPTENPVTATQVEKSVNSGNGVTDHPQQHVNLLCRQGDSAPHVFQEELCQILSLPDVSVVIHIRNLLQDCGENLLAFSTNISDTAAP